MADLFVILAVTVFVIGLFVALKTDHSWKSVALVWGILALGSVLFGIGLTLSAH